MDQARLVSLVHRLRYAHRLNQHVPLRKEIAALERAICVQYGHTMNSGMQICAVCNITQAAHEARVGLRTNNTVITGKPQSAAA